MTKTPKEILESYYFRCSCTFLADGYDAKYMQVVHYASVHHNAEPLLEYCTALRGHYRDTINDFIKEHGGE